MGTQLLFRFVASAYERRSLGVGSHWPFEEWGRFLPEHTMAVSMLDRLLHHASAPTTASTKTNRLDSRLLARLPLEHPESLHEEHGLGRGHR